MYFAALPPEINSGRMYSGPGSAPMLAAAMAWDSVGAELQLAASAFASVIAGLTSGPWLGPASLSMAATTSAHVSWMHATAAISEQTAAQAKAAAAAFETAFAMTVPPPVIAANRATLMALIATNFFGQNAPAIAATEALYGEMWAQDAAAMYGYADSSLLATSLTSFTPPGWAGNAPEALDALDAAEAPAESGAQQAATTASQLAATSPQAVQQATASSPTTAAPVLPDPIELWKMHVPAMIGTAATANWFTGIPDKFYSFVTSMLPEIKAAEALAAADAAAGLPSLGGLLGGAAGGGSVAAAMGNAGSVGGMSVPAAWASAAPPSTAASPFGFSGIRGAEASSSLLRGMPLTGVGGQRASSGYTQRYGFRHSVMPRPPAAG